MKTSIHLLKNMRINFGKRFFSFYIDFISFLYYNKSIKLYNLIKQGGQKNGIRYWNFIVYNVNNKENHHYFLSF